MPEYDLAERITHAAEALKGLGAAEVYIFGSAATGEMRPDSDVDIAVRGLPPREFFRAMGLAWDILGRPVDLLRLDAGSRLARYLEDKGKLQRVG
jgi:predicted nucleotidyltransferase